MPAPALRAPRRLPEPRAPERRSLHRRAPQRPLHQVGRWRAQDEDALFRALGGAASLRCTCRRLCVGRRCYENRCQQRVRKPDPVALDEEQPGGLGQVEITVDANEVVERLRQQRARSAGREARRREVSLAFRPAQRPGAAPSAARASAARAAVLRLRLVTQNGQLARELQRVERVALRGLVQPQERRS